MLSTSLYYKDGLKHTVRYLMCQETFTIRVASYHISLVLEEIEQFKRKDFTRPFDVLPLGKKYHHCVKVTKAIVIFGKHK